MRRAHRLVTEQPSLSLPLLLAVGPTNERLRLRRCNCATARQARSRRSQRPFGSGPPAAWMIPNYICHCQTTFPHRKWGAGMLGIPVQMLQWCVITTPLRLKLQRHCLVILVVGTLFLCFICKYSTPTDILLMPYGKNCDFTPLLTDCGIDQRLPLRSRHPTVTTPLRQIFLIAVRIETRSTERGRMSGRTNDVGQQSDLLTR